MVSQILFDVVSKPLFRFVQCQRISGARNDGASNVHLECESTSEDGGQEDGIPADEGSITAQ